MPAYSQMSLRDKDFRHSRTPASPFALVPNDLQHGCGVGRLFEGLPELGFVQEFGNIGQGVQMFLELTLRHQEQHHQVNRLIVQRI